MAEDKRIRKTRDVLRNSLRTLMETKSFEDVTVMEICKLACISRITFYARYNDKDELLHNLFNDFGNKCLQLCIDRNRENNREGDAKKFGVNLFTSAMQVVTSGWSPCLERVVTHRGYAFDVFITYMHKNVEEMLKKLESEYLFAFSHEQTLAIACDGVIEFIRATALLPSRTPEEIKIDCEKYFSAILDLIAPHKIHNAQ